MINGKVFAISVAILMGLGFTLMFLACIFEKSENKTRNKNAGKMSFVGFVILITSMIGFFIGTGGARNTSTPIKSTEHIVEEINITEISDRAVILENDTAFDYVNGEEDVEVLLNTNDKQYKVVKYTDRHLLDYFVETYRHETRYEVYVDEETKESMDSLMEYTSTLWKAN